MNVKLREKYNNLINEYNTKLRSIRTVQRYQNYIIKKRKEDYIETLESEIEELREEGKDRQVKTREQKLSRIIAGEYTTKAELKLIEEVNFSSQKQMVDLLYNSNHGFKFPVIAYTVDKHKKPTNNPSTAEDTLIKLKEHDKSGFIDTLLDLRGVQTINSTFIVGLGDLVQSDGGVHPTFLIHGTVSGRLSSRNPNGQNIPKTMVNPDVKLQFIPPKNQLFLSYDYSQAELRILAHLANESTMLEWFRTGKDIHLASACKKYHEDYDEIIKIYQDEQHPEYKLWKKEERNLRPLTLGLYMNNLLEN